MKKILELKNVTAGYENYFYISEINFSIFKKDYIGIIGPNGAGKTTLFKTILKIIKPIKGEIFFNEQNIYKIPNNEFVKNISVVSTNIETQFFSVEDYVLFGRIPHFKKFQFFETKKDLEIINYYMELTGIKKLKNKKINEISSGEKQLTAITRALVQEPKLLLLDESTAHLDLNHQLHILSLLKKLRDELNLTIMITFHNLNLAAEFCDKIILLKEGKILKIGLPDETITNENIRQLYNINVLIEKNKITKKPNILFIPDEK
ncbi:MAG TPA: ABC transporter ATP-binding protein [bacterium]|nr:ABC transporter ATP-binding protein [bacterium]HOL46879.1 ABC transporter ATP-binding protein [bacterium]HPQ18772.1 ABC transporter ATP-binding protein [bacterium]